MTPEYSYDFDTTEAAALKHVHNKIRKMREQSQEDKANGKDPDLKYELLRATYYVTMRKMQIREPSKKMGLDKRCSEHKKYGIQIHEHKTFKKINLQKKNLILHLL